MSDYTEAEHGELVDSLIRYGIGGGMGYPEGAVEGALAIVKKSRWLAAHDAKVRGAALKEAEEAVRASGGIVGVLNTEGSLARYRAIDRIRALAQKPPEMG